MVKFIQHHRHRNLAFGIAVYSVSAVLRCLDLYNDNVQTVLTSGMHFACVVDGNSLRAYNFLPTYFFSLLICALQAKLAPCLLPTQHGSSN
jgi:hypothetical protein